MKLTVKPSENACPDCGNALPIEVGGYHEEALQLLRDLLARCQSVILAAECNDIRHHVDYLSVVNDLHALLKRS